MPKTRVISVDPAPRKPSAVFDGEDYCQKSPSELREYLRDLIDQQGGIPLLCWDAPLTGPTDITKAGLRPGDFTIRRIEQFFRSEKIGFKSPKGISVLGYGACPHWSITRSLLGLPRIGKFDVPESRLPFRLLTQLNHTGVTRPSVVEIHPAVAAWLWCRRQREGKSWVYKGKGKKEPASAHRQVRVEMWDIIRKKTKFTRRLPCPETGDKFDAAVGYILGTLLTQGQSDAVMILGNERDGAWLLPRYVDVINAWGRFLNT